MLIEAPTQVIVTERDEVVPADLSRRVYEAAAGPKRLVVLDAAHDNASGPVRRRGA